MNDSLRGGLSTAVAVIMTVFILYACAAAAHSYAKSFRRALGGGQAALPSRAAWPLRGMCLCALAALASRLLLYAVSFAYAPLGDVQPQMREMWVRWDAPNYLSIVQDGYVTQGDQAYYIVFFPLYPFIVRLVTFLTNDAFAASLVVSNLCFCGAAALLYASVCARAGHKAGLYAAAWLCLWPASFFYAAPMTESLFMLLCVGSLLAVERKAYIAAGVMGMLCALTRSPGVALALPIALAAALDCAAAPQGTRAARAVKGAVGAALAPVGLAAYCLLNYLVTGDPFRFLLYQREHWSQQMGFFWGTIRMTADYMLSMDGNTPYIWFPQLLSMAVCTLVLCLSVRKLEPTAALYFCAMFIISISPTWLLSGVRYMSGIAPLYVALGTLTVERPARFLPALGASGALLLVYLAPYIWYRTVM